MARAKAQGFDVDTVLYHGTESGGFAAFDEDLFNSSSGTGGDGFYFTDAALNAATYSNTRPTQVVDVQRDIGKIDEDGYEIEFDPTPGIYEVYLKLGNSLTVDFDGRNWDGTEEGEFDGFESVPEVVNRAREQGYDSVVVKNVSDEGPHGQGYNWGNVTTVVFDPSNIRSVNAAFNDVDVGSDNILAQRQMAKRRDMLQKLKDCLAA
jgi:hypothetical protein